MIGQLGWATNGFYRQNVHCWFWALIHFQSLQFIYSPTPVIMHIYSWMIKFNINKAVLCTMLKNTTAVLNLGIKSTIFTSPAKLVHNYVTQWSWYNSHNHSWSAKGYKLWVSINTKTVWRLNTLHQYKFLHGVLKVNLNCMIIIFVFPMCSV